MIQYLDLRSKSVSEVESVLRKRNSEGAYITAWQAAALGNDVLRAFGNRLIVTVPDFLNYARLLNTGQAMTMVGLPGSIARSVVAAGQAGIGSITRVPRLAGMEFWAVADVLLRYDLALLPKDFGGTICLHSHLVDFACVFDQAAFIGGYFRQAGTKAGVHTQQLPMCLSGLSRWSLQPSVVSFLCSTGDDNGKLAIAAAKQGRVFHGAKWIAEMDSWPLDMQRARIAERACGATVDGILVSERTGSTEVS